MSEAQSTFQLHCSLTLTVVIFDYFSVALCKTDFSITEETLIVHFPFYFIFNWSLSGESKQKKSNCLTRLTYLIIPGTFIVIKLQQHTHITHQCY